MKLTEYIDDKKYWLCGCFFYMLLTEGIMLLFGVQTEAQIFLTGLFCLSMTAFFFFDFRKRSLFFNRIRDILDGMEEKYLLTELLEAPSYLEGRLTYACLEEVLKAMNDEIARHERLGNEFKSYIETWIHEIKIPIASAELMLHNLYADSCGNDSVRRLKGQLGRIEEDVEQVLYYIRSEVPENDYVIGVHSLKSIVQEAVKDQKDSLILHHFSVQVELKDELVRTDQKWLAFMLRQIISNAVKYAGSDTGSLRFFCRTDTADEQEPSLQLVIEDHGVGISKGDITRIFEKSFTGKNGRNAASTGMGLYICQRLCRELGHTIGAESEQGVYTRIWIAFSPVKREQA